MLTVLLVDDEIFFRQGLRAIVDWESCGFQVIGEEDNGEDAYHFIMRENPDLVITDIRMPEVDGLQLIHKVVQEQKLKTKFIIVSGYDEFKYAQQAVKYGVCDFLLKPIDEISLEETLRHISENIRDEQQQYSKTIAQQSMEIIENLERSIIDDQYLIDCYNKLELDYNEGHYFVIIESSYEWGSMTEELQLDYQFRVIQSLISNFKLEHMLTEKGRVALIISEKLIVPQHSIHAFVRKLFDRLSSDFEFYISYSELYRGIHFLPQAYRSAKHASHFKYVDDRQIFNAEQLKSIELRSIMLPIESYRELLHQVEINDEGGIEQEVDQLLHQFGQAQCSIEAIKMTVHKLVVDCLHIVQTMKIDKTRLKHLHELISGASTYMNRNSLRKQLLLFTKDCAKCMADERKEMSKGGIQRVKKYIDEHYAEPISLKSIAAKFYINPVYLGQLFKKNYESYFNDYLLKLRINEAKKLLRQTDMKIYEVSDRVGFSHCEYFVAQFEKLEKLSPTAYRQTFKSMAAGDNE